MDKKIEQRHAGVSRQSWIKWGALCAVAVVPLMVFSRRTATPEVTASPRISAQPAPAVSPATKTVFIGGQVYSRTKRANVFVRRAPQAATSSGAAMVAGNPEAMPPVASAVKTPNAILRGNSGLGGRVEVLSPGEFAYAQGRISSTGKAQVECLEPNHPRTPHIHPGSKFRDR